MLDRYKKLLKLYRMAKYTVKKELMGGDVYWMIYKKVLWWTVFFERWNTEPTAKVRLNELNGTL